ncbi:NAD(P)-binding domain-containing protein [Aestuariivirga sp.]|uniref:NAD(P)-binding domain-containing protein n=1 Tax=Aestuariivirga sp. TaxID=2650926 RepID=UPI00391B6140
MIERHDTVIVGGGQAALAMSYCLQQRNVEHLVLERKRLAERWRSERWDSLAFQMPNWSLQLPGMGYEGSDPDGFATHGEILAFIERYAERIKPPLREATEVTCLRAAEDRGYEVETPDGLIRADRVVIATGPFHAVAVPEFAASLPGSVYQIGAAHYKSPEALPAGSVVVVGSGSSGTQIADELLRAGRRVFLSVGKHRYAPRRYRGRDVIWWYEKLGRFDVPIDAFPGRRYPPPTVMTGVDGGYDLFPRKLEREGCVLVGRIEGAANGWLVLGNDVDSVLQNADASCAEFIAAADALGDEIGLPPRSGEDAGLPPPSCAVSEPMWSINLKAENVTSVIWASGYACDYSWLKVPVLDERGSPVQSRGITACSGIYFLGLHWMHTFRSGLLSYVGGDAAHVAEHMCERSR